MPEASQVVVLGMHRSGTSALSMLLNELGVHFGLGRDFINPKQDNPKGFWERRDVRRLNDHVLHALECEWDEISLLDLENLSLAELAYFETTARDILTSLAPQSLIGIKEPRICVLLPLWQRVFSKPLYLFSWREPAEIALSLRNRNSIPENVGEALSACYVNTALSNINGAPMLGVDYAKLLTEPLAQAERIADFLKQHSNTQVLNPKETEILSLISPELNHSAPQNKQLKNQGSDLQALKERVLSNQSLQQPLDLSTQKEQLKNYELRKRFALRLEVSALRKQKELDQTELRYLLDSHRSSQQRSDKDLAVHEAHKKAVDEMRTISSQEKLSHQYEIAEKEVELFKLQENLTNYQKLNQLLFKFFQTKLWRACSAIISLGAKTGLAPNAAKIMHRIISLRARITADGDFFEDQSDSNCTVERSTIAESDTEAPSFSLIVLNRSGEDHLKALFQSLLRFENSRDFEIIIVDHNSTDGSLEFIRNHFSKMRITLLAYGGNNSFSYGCNQGALHASGDKLVFLNNDIILDQSVLADMQEILQNSGACAVGLPLYYPDTNKHRSADIQHAGIEFSEDKDLHFQRPYNVKLLDNEAQWQPFPAVTAAFLMCERQQFAAVGGFCERYQYGYEDVDLCLSLSRQCKTLPVLANQLGAIHDESASQNKDNALAVTLRRHGNIATLKTRYGEDLNRYGTCARLAQYGEPDEAQAYKVGLVVTEDTAETSAGDFFTAAEFAQALTAELGWECIYRSQRSKTHDWYDASELDCLIVLVDRYDIRKIRNAKTTLLTVAWVRNWFERWPTHEWFRDYKLVLSSSQHGAAYLRNACNRPCQLLRIATNENRFVPEAAFTEQQKSDYCFTGSYWNVKREIENFHPENLPYDFALYGHGWDKHSQFRKYYRGFLKYQDLPAIYSGTKLLVDDANHVTRPWASVNSRVFDGIAAGAMVITNGDAGAQEVFGHLLPSYESVDELEEQITSLLSNEQLRTQQAEALRKEVLEKHTYTHRAREFSRILKRQVQQLRQIAIKIGVPSHAQAAEWGDFHFAKALQKEFLRLGHRCRIDILPEWYGKHTSKDDVVLVLRGLSQYKPSRDQLNLLWMISHPDKISNTELDQFDHVFVASLSYTETLRSQTSTPCSALMQCTDNELFYPTDDVPSTDEAQATEQILFVGNSRLQYRKIVKDAIEAELDIEVYGSRWETIIPSKYIRGTHLDNASLRQHYSSASILLNDHWETMQEHGFVSNRLFDAAAAGATVVSDDIEGLNELFQNALYSYDGSSEHLAIIVSQAKNEKNDRKRARQALAEHVREHHSFEARAKEIHRIICANSLVNLLAGRIDGLEAVECEQSA